MNKTTVLSLLIAFFVNVHAAQDPFTPYLDAKSPTIVRELSRKDSAGINIREIVFQSRDSSEIYAVIATPNSAGKHPALLVLHGGMGCAERDKAIAWAQRGYVAVAPDLPSIADPLKIKNSKGRWSGMPYGKNRYVASPDARASFIFDAVLSAMKSLYLLRSQPNVDLSNVGVVGISWGGYMTTMVCALAGDQVKAGFSVFGSGCYELTSQASNLKKMPEKEMQEWLQWLDPGVRAGNIMAKFFIAGATNDFFFYPKAVQKTLDLIPSEHNQVYAPNVSHTIPLPGGSVAIEEANQNFVPTKDQPFSTPKGSKANWLTMEVPYMEYYLKGIGKPFPKVKILNAKDLSTVNIEVTSSNPITSVVVYWSVSGPDPKKCEWKKLEVQSMGKNRYQVHLPAEVTDWFVVASDNRPVSVSSALMVR